MIPQASGGASLVVDPQALQQLAQKLSATGMTLGQYRKRFEASVANVTTSGISWLGQGATSFTGAAAKWSQAARALETLLNEAATTVHNTVRGYQQAIDLALGPARSLGLSFAVGGSYDFGVLGSEAQARQASLVQSMQHTHNHHRIMQLQHELQQVLTVLGAVQDAAQVDQSAAQALVAMGQANTRRYQQASASLTRWATPQYIHHLRQHATNRAQAITHQIHPNGGYGGLATLVTVLNFVSAGTALLAACTVWFPPAAMVLEGVSAATAFGALVGTAALAFNGQATDTQVALAAVGIVPGVAGLAVTEKMGALAAAEETAQTASAASGESSAASQVSSAAEAQVAANSVSSSAEAASATSGAGSAAQDAVPTAEPPGGFLQNLGNGYSDLLSKQKWSPSYWLKANEKVSQAMWKLRLVEMGLDKGGGIYALATTGIGGPSNHS